MYLRRCGCHERILADFSDSQQSGFFTTATGHEALIMRSREGPDEPRRAGMLATAAVLARLSYHFGREDFPASGCCGCARLYGRQIARYPRAFAKRI